MDGVSTPKITIYTISYVSLLYASIIWNKCILLNLKLVRTYLNYSVQGTSTAAVFLSNDHSLYAPITSDKCQP